LKGISIRESPLHPADFVRPVLIAPFCLILISFDWQSMSKIAIKKSNA